MTANWSSELQVRAKAKADEINQKRRSPRFQKVIGKLYAAGLLTSNDPIKPFHETIRVADCIWAGRIEPRILELLPALILKRPSYFSDLDRIPSSLRLLIADIRKGRATEDFFGIPAKLYLNWIPIIGQRGKQPSLLKAFRFRQEDLADLEEIKRAGYSEIEAIRLGLKLARMQVTFKPGA